MRLCGEKMQGYICAESRICKRTTERKGDKTDVFAEIHKKYFSSVPERVFVL